jgi:probable phosphoglycerate mutase
MTLVSLSHPLVLIRHGETDWNVARRLQGHEDIPLNDRGRVQARRNGGVLRDHFASGSTDPADWHFVASPLSRADETMRLVRGELGLDPDGHARDQRLIELGFGRWAGLEMSEVAVSDPHGHAAREADRWNARPPGGESMADGAARVGPLLAALDRPTVIVSHGGLIRVIHVVLGLTDVAGTRHLPTPQDRFHVVTGKRVTWL